MSEILKALKVKAILFYKSVRYVTPLFTATVHMCVQSVLCLFMCACRTLWALTVP